MYCMYIVNYVYIDLLTGLYSEIPHNDTIRQLVRFLRNRDKMANKFCESVSVSVCSMEIQ